MTTKNKTFVCEEESGQCCPKELSSIYENGSSAASMELYVFIDPLCPECWALEPAIKKLKMEYGRYLKLNLVLANNLEPLHSSCGSKHRSLMKEMAQAYNETGCRTGMPCDGDVWYKNPAPAPYDAMAAIKAAGLQGKVIGAKYLRRVREALFLHKENIADQQVLIDCAMRVSGMDVDEFVRDLHSDTTKKALDNDRKTAEEMDIRSTPTIVFFNEDIDEPGLKVEGAYRYEIYEDLLREMSGEKLEKCPPIPLEEFVAFYSLVATKEIAVVYDMKQEEAHREMKKLQLQQKVEEIPTKHGSIWRSVAAMS
ncbi:ClpXP adapter SpxH family protein [Alkalicoccus luteus]|uniref:ClpXP adapter SpxH family protein n=1 Tax=Alkalicoccus luteus TaxID=1237094 RepID=UPI00197C533D|nr:ClpXP adapter SpxH family protein [Alkalicoccus luteus]